MRYYWNQYSPYVVGALVAVLVVLSFAKCDPDTVTIEKPTVTIKEVRHTDTVLSTIEVTNRIYIPFAEPTFNDSTRATLDTSIVRDSSQVILHVEFNKLKQTFENLIADFKVPVVIRELTKYVDREIRIEIPTEIEKPEGWFRAAAGFVVGVLATIIAVLL